MTATELRGRILDATERLLARYGYRKMTMEDIALEARVAKRTIYLHFPSKEEVALCSIDRVVERLLEQLRAIACVEATPEHKVRQMLRTRILFRFDSVQEYYESFHNMFAAIRPAYLTRRERYFQAEAEILSQALQEGAERGLFVVADPGHTAHTLLLATNALLPYSLSPRELQARATVEDNITRLAELLLDGLRRRDS